jgi:hypothetical protein
MNSSFEMMALRMHINIVFLGISLELPRESSCFKDIYVSLEGYLQFLSMPDGFL